VGDRGERSDSLTLDRIMEILATDLKERGMEFRVSSDPLTDAAWIVLFKRIYTRARAPKCSVATANAPGQDSHGSAGTQERRPGRDLKTVSVRTPSRTGH
jgi:hypothetical protein